MVMLSPYEELVLHLRIESTFFLPLGISITNDMSICVLCLCVQERGLGWCLVHISDCSVMMDLETSFIYRCVGNLT